MEAVIQVAAAIFKSIEVIDNANGTASIIFDLDEEELRLLESIFGIEYSNTEKFEEEFNIFVNKAIISYLNRKAYD